MTSDVSRDGAWPRPRLWAGAAALVLVVVGACGGPDRSTDDDRSTVTTTVPQPSTTGSISADPAGPEPPPATGEECLAPADDADQAWFGPGRRLGGYVIGSGSRWVVLGHQSDGTSCQMLPIGRQLVRAGYRVIAIDFSGRGSSVQSDADHALSADVVAAVQYAAAHGASEVALLGASLGGYAVLGSVPELGDRVGAVVSLSAPSDYPDGGSTVSLSGVTTPVLLYVGRDDLSFVGPNQDFARQDPDAVLHVLPTSSHGVELADEAVLAGILRFLDQSL